jgi:DNA-binding transcriptional ArsR family regulator
MNASKQSGAPRLTRTTTVGGARSEQPAASLGAPGTVGGVDDDVVTLAVEVLRILADPTRLRIAVLLLNAELSVSELADAVQRPVAGVSQHLAKMRLAHLVATRREGTTVRYRIDDEHIRQLVLDTTRHVEHLLFDRPAHHEKGGPR